MKIIQILLGSVLGAAVLMAPISLIQAQTTDAPPASPPGQIEVPQSEAPQAMQLIFEAMIGAIEDNNRAAFLAFADARFKAALTPPQFQSVVDQLASRLQKGHAFKYLGEMK